MDPCRSCQATFPGARAVGLKFYSASRTGAASFVVPLFDSESGQLPAIMEANTSGYSYRCRLGRGHP